MPTVGALFAGYGGLEQALAMVDPGARPVWFSEIDPAPSAVLAHHYPDVPNLGDITKIDWQEVRRMAWPRKDEQACAMYERYQAGLSLAEVGAEFGRSRQAVFGLFQSRGWELRQRPSPLPPVEYRGLLYTVRNTGYYGCTTGDRHLLHRAMWEVEIGPIPDGWDVHHLNENKRDNRIDNFECLPKADHTRFYSPHCNQHKHNCSADFEGVMPDETPGVDILTGGFP